MQEKLLDFGFSSREATVYMVLLKNGNASASRIAALANVPRSSIYDILEKLKHQGYVSTVIRDKKLCFIANEPRSVLTMLDDHKHQCIREIQEKRGRFKKLLPKLNAIYGTAGQKPMAEIFEGQSIAQVLDQIVSNASLLRVMGSQENAVRRIGYRTDRFRMRRVRRKIRLMQLLEDSRESRKEKTDKYTRIRYLPVLGKSHEATFIYSDTTVHLILSDEPAAIRIRSLEYSKSREIVFDELWKNARQ